MFSVNLPGEMLENSNLRKDLPDAFLQASAIWTGVKEKISNYIERDGTSVYLDRDSEKLEGIFTKSCWGWLPSCRIVRFDKMDRLGQHFYGPMYTCKGYEWPEYKGCPFRPWVQLDLGKASEIAGVDLGKGLLQFFETPEFDCHEKYFVRHIPQVDISIKAMTPVPHFTPSMAEIFEKYFECPPDALFGDKAKCIKVKAFDRKVFSMMDTDLDIEFLDEIAKEDIEDIVDLLYSLKKEVKKAAYRMRLFGCDHPIQTLPEESWDVLLNLGHCDRQSRDLRNNLPDSFILFNGGIYFDGTGAIHFCESIDGMGAVSSCNSGVDVAFFFLGSRF